MSWRYVNAAVRGTSHERGDVPCQDDCLVDAIPVADEELLIAIASDGAGSATCAEEGSGLVCESLVPAIETWLHGGGTIEAITRDVVDQWIEGVRADIAARAKERELTPRDFACTLVAAIAGAQAAVLFQIGDGTIVVGSDSVYDVVFWPDGGEYANTTFFVTDEDWAKHVHFEVRHQFVVDVALMTDGLQRLALHFRTRSAHVPFFAPMFDALQRAAPGFAGDLEPALVAFLDSADVNARTDDDKSLVLATRRPGVGHGAF